MVWVAAKAVSHHDDGGWTVDGVSGLRDELAGEGPGPDTEEGRLKTKIKRTSSSGCRRSQGEAAGWPENDVMIGM